MEAVTCPFVVQTQPRVMPVAWHKCIAQFLLADWRRKSWASLARQERDGEIFMEHQLGTSHSLATFIHLL